MDRLSKYREILRQVLNGHIQFASLNKDIKFEPVFDQETDRYMVMLQGWDGRRRIHSCVIHVDIIDGKFWIQHDGTDYGIAQELFDAGVPKENIVLGFKSAELRRYTEFATA